MPPRSRTSTWATCVHWLSHYRQAAEQVRIVNEIERVISVESATSEVVASNVLRVSRLRQSILKWAFEGRLVDQDTTDEPAARLLERIRAERVAHGESTPKSQGRGRRARAQSGMSGE